MSNKLKTMFGDGFVTNTSVNPSIDCDCGCENCLNCTCTMPIGSIGVRIFQVEGEDLAELYFKWGIGAHDYVLFAQKP